MGVSVSKGSEGLTRVPGMEEPIDILDLTARSTNALRNHGIYSVRDLIESTEWDIGKHRGVGKKTLDEIMSCKAFLEKSVSAAPAAVERSTAGAGHAGRTVQKASPRGRKVIVRAVAPAARPDTDGRQSLQAEINRRIDIFLSDVKQANNIHILQQRVQGRSLGAIARDRGVSRQRIEQMEKKATKLLRLEFESWGQDVLAYADADAGLNGVITMEALRSYFSQITDFGLFLYSLKNKSIGNAYTFQKNNQIFVKNGYSHKVMDIAVKVSELPHIIEDSEKDPLLMKLAEDKGIPESPVYMEFDKIYHKPALVWCRKRLTLLQMHDYLIRKYYPEGIKLYNTEVLDEFVKLAKKTFGDIYIAAGGRAIYSQIVRIGILSNRGAYIHPSYMRISPKLVEKIEEYIQASPRNTFSFNALYDKFKLDLNHDSNVTNRYFLQGALGYYLKDKYYFTRDSISKSQGSDLSQEIEKFVKERKTVTKMEIFAEFRGMTQIVLDMRVKSLHSVIYAGGNLYIHSDVLKIKDSDYDIKGILDKLLKNGPVSSRKLLEELKKSKPQFIMNNIITDHNRLFGIMQYMFGDDYTFSRPYISSLDIKMVTRKDALLSYLKDYDEITIMDLLEMCSKNQIKFLSIRQLITTINDEFLRIDEKTLCRIDEDLDDDILDKIYTQIRAAITANRYLALTALKNFKNYPDIEIDWNSFILRAIVEKYFSEQIHILDIPTSNSYIMNSILVDAGAEQPSYEEIVRGVMTKELKRKSLANTQELTEFLRANGLMVGKLPKCLTDNSIIRKNSAGKYVLST
jgi:hypothetical protein